MKIHENGYWINETNEGHAHDQGLAEALRDFFEAENSKINSNPNSHLTILDVGCGDGYYTNYLNNGHLRVVGIDGNPNTSAIGGCFTYGGYDLSKNLPLMIHEWVLCLEVGEHIPEEFESTFIENLDRSNVYGMVLSWATRGQGGDGHVNCKDNHEVISRITKIGYTLDEDATNILRNSVATYPIPCYWFRNTLMVFRRNETCSQGYNFSLG